YSVSSTAADQPRTSARACHSSSLPAVSITTPFAGSTMTPQAVPMVQSMSQISGQLQAQPVSSSGRESAPHQPVRRLVLERPSAITRRRPGASMSAVVVRFAVMPPAVEPPDVADDELRIVVHRTQVGLVEQSGRYL